MKRPKRREWLTNIGLSVGSLVLFIGAMEILLRVTGLETTEVKSPPIYQKSEDPHISYELVPNIQERAFRATVTTNSQGFRGSEIDTTKPLIAILGDSIAFGYGLEDDETFAVHMQKHMPSFHFLNAAVPGYSLLEETATYETKVKPLNPDGVILVFYFNDLTAGKPSFLDDQNILRADGWKPEYDTCTGATIGALGFIPGACWLNKHSVFFIKFKKIANTISAHRRVAKEHTISQSNPQKDILDASLMDTYEMQLDAFVKLLPTDAPRIFIIAPDHTQHPIIAPQLIRIAKERGFTVINLYEPFPTPQKTLGWDLHPHASTIAAAAEYIAKKLEEENILASIQNN